MHKNFSRIAAMPWNRRRARLNEIQLQRTNGTLSTQLLREHSRHADEKAEHMAMFVDLMLDLNDAVAAKQSVACVRG
jgi:hypothetical protein